MEYPNMDNSSEVAQTPQKRTEWVIPDYPPLDYKDCVGKAAVEGQIYLYPKVARSIRDDPVPGQSFALISNMIFSEPRKLRNGKMVYGFTKIRGVYADTDQAKRFACKIIREMDSKHQIRIAEVGAWVPITEEDAFVKEQLDVRMDEKEIHLRDEAAKEKEAKQRQIMKEIREREDECKTGDIYDDPTSLTYYSMRRVTNNVLGESIQRQINQLESTKKIRRKVQKELKRIEIDHPEYNDQWVERYNEERRKGGCPDYVPSEEQLEEHNNLKFDNLEISDDESDEKTGTEKLREEI